MRFITATIISFFVLLILSQCSNNKSENYSEKIKGEFILKGSTCAGFNFISTSRLDWTNEMDCHPIPFTLRWIDNTTFYIKDSLKLAGENCPPRVNIYRVISFDGKNLVLSEFNTAWTNAPDEKIEFKKNDTPDK